MSEEVPVNVFENLRLAAEGLATGRVALTAARAEKDRAIAAEAEKTAEQNQLQEEFNKAVQDVIDTALPGTGWSDKS